MALGFNLLHSAPVPALILNADIIPSSAKRPIADGSSEKISHISGSSIFGVYATVQPGKKYYNTKEQYRWFVTGISNF